MFGTFPNFFNHLKQFYTLVNLHSNRKWSRNEDDVPIETEDIPASYVSLPGGNPLKFNYKFRKFRIPQVLQIDCITIFRPAAPPEHSYKNHQEKNAMPRRSCMPMLVLVSRFWPIKAHFFWWFWEFVDGC